MVCNYTSLEGRTQVTQHSRKYEKKKNIVQQAGSTKTYIGQHVYTHRSTAVSKKTISHTRRQEVSKHRLQMTTLNTHAGRRGGNAHKHGSEAHTIYIESTCQ